MRYDALIYAHASLVARATSLLLPFIMMPPIVVAAVEKKVKELEKQNAKLKERNKELKGSMADKDELIALLKEKLQNKKVRRAVIIAPAPSPAPAAAAWHMVG